MNKIHLHVNFKFSNGVKHWYLCNSYLTFNNNNATKEHDKVTCKHCLKYIKKWEQK